MTDDTDPTPYSAFISYASANRALAEAVVAELEGNGLRCWIASRDARPGEEYASEIIRGIVQSKHFVLLLSEAANLSAHVRREVERAASKAKPIYPVRIEDVQPSPKLEYFISMHHWIDAWDGQIALHVERLRNAFDSSEEWTGNKVLRRRRHLSIGGVAALSVVALITALVFAGDVRQMFQSDSERARRELAAIGVTVDVSGMANALVGSNIVQLDLLRRAGVTRIQLAEALRTTLDGGKRSVAQLFFQNSRNSPEVVGWLRKMLNAGLDPDLLVPHPYYEKEGMLIAAIRAGNAEAAMAIVEAGASPHAYQNLWFTQWPIPRFLFPYDSLLGEEKLSSQQKQKLAMAYQNAGATFLSLDKAGYTGNGEPEAQLGLKINTAPGRCEHALRTPTCESATKRTGIDWCELAAGLPKQVAARSKESYSPNLGRFDLNGLINVIDNKAYFSGSETGGTYVNYLLVEITQDTRIWRVYKYLEPQGGKGFCKKDENSGLTPNRCWRRIDMTYDATDKVMLVENYYKYDVKMSCGGN